MIDRASAEISKCIMRLKRKDAKKPPEIPPKPVLNSNNSSSPGTGNNGTVSSNNTNPFHQALNSQSENNGGSGGGSSNPFQNQMSTTATNKHGGIAVLPHHITTLTSSSGGSSSGSNGQGGGGIISGNGGGGINMGPSSNTIIQGLGGMSSINCTPTTPRKFPTLQKKTPKHKKLISHHTQLWTDEDFLKMFFSKYFIGSEKLVLPIVCRKWRDVTYGMGRLFWGDLVPVLKCKELRGVRPDLNAGIRRRFYGGLVKRGFTSLKLHSATDEDAEDVIIHYSQGSSLVETLRISSSCLTDKGLFNLLDHLGNLQELELSSCNEITEEGFNAAIPKKGLLRLVIYDCIHIADTAVTFVARNLTSLHCLEIQAYHVTDSALASFNPKCNSALTVLKLNSCWELTNQTVLHIVSGLPQLRMLSLSGCSKITDEGVEVLAENLNQLKTLDLSWCPRITDASLECIACDLACLEGLILDRCSLITDLGIGYLATMPSLKVLSLRWCSIRDTAVHHMISMKKLQYLSLAGCTSIAPSTLCSLTALRNLKELELTNCGVTPQVLHFLRNTLSCILIE